MATIHNDEKTFKKAVTFEAAVVTSGNVTASATVQGADVTATDDLTVGDAVTFSALPQYADDTAAGAGGLTAGRLYRTAAGVVMVKLA